MADLKLPETSSETTDERPLTVGGAACLGAPETFQYREAATPTCPPASEPCIHVVREMGNVTLSSELAVDATKTGRYAAEADLEDATLAAGETVDAYLLHLNEVPEGTGLLEGRVRFAGEIVGVAATTSTLQTGDSIVGSSNRSYPSGRMARGLDWSEREYVDIGDDHRTLRVRLRSNRGLDELRVFIATD
jgi:hypothetical protein